MLYNRNNTIIRETWRVKIWTLKLKNLVKGQVNKVKKISKIIQKNTKIQNMRE